MPHTSGDAPSNFRSFLEGQGKYFATSYEQFEAFGGPCVYFRSGRDLRTAGYEAGAAEPEADDAHSKHRGARSARG